MPERRWTIAVCPECNEVELWSESVVVYCGTCGRRLVDDAVEVVEAAPVEAEIKRLRDHLGQIATLNTPETMSRWAREALKGKLA